DRSQRRFESRLLHRPESESVCPRRRHECRPRWALRWSNGKLWPRGAGSWFRAQSRCTHGSSRTKDCKRRMITIAIAKGRMQDDALALLARAGVRLNEEARNSRRLAIADDSGEYRFIFVKPADVPVYVEHGIADCGVVGRDVLLESQADLLLPLDRGNA